MDKLGFAEACRRVKSGGRLLKGIGTRGEGSVHAVLKSYFEPDISAQEQEIGGYIADAVGENGITEIQTGHFSSLAPKLERFLSVSRVTVVYPVYVKKTIVTTDSKTGCEKRRVSPLKGSAYDIFPELFPIARLLKSENLSIRIMLLECDEYRLPPESLGRKRSKRGRLSVADRVPTALLGETAINSPEDWQQLIPCLFDSDYTSAELAEKAGISAECARTALGLLYRSDIVRRTGKRGNAYTYRFFRSERKIADE